LTVTCCWHRCALIMSSSSRPSKEKPRRRQLPTKDRQSPAAAADNSGRCHSSNTANFLSIYNVRFPANICEHQPPAFVWRPVLLPDRGAGAVVVPAEKTSPRISPEPKTSPTTKALAEAGLSRKAAAKRPITTVGTVAELTESQDSKMSVGEVKITRRETKNR